MSEREHFGDLVVDGMRILKCIFKKKDRKALTLRCVIPVVCRITNGEVNISHENTTMVVWIYDSV